MTTEGPQETSILFKPEMVLAILEGRKTQTRRVVKLPKLKHYIWGDPERWRVDPGGTDIFGPGPYLKAPQRPLDPRWANDPDHETWHRIHCPYGYPEYGDKLWVRETHRIYETDEGPRVVYRATEHEAPEEHRDYWGVQRWRPSIHMPRWACRLVLDVTNVRVERLHEVEPVDVLREGVGWPELSTADLRLEFATLWDRINGRRAPWASNPWVWVVDFEVIDG